MRLMLALATLALLAQPAAAQQAGTGWRIQTQEGLTAALQAWPGGWALVVRCQNGNLDTYLRSPVEVAGDATLRLTVDNGPPLFVLQPASRVASSTVFAQRSLTLSRAVRTGQVLEIKDANDAPLAELALGEDADEPVAAVLTACDRPLERPGSPEPPEPLDTVMNPNWAARPQAIDLASLLPERWDPDIHVYETFVSCILTERGGLRDCELEWESPPGYGFGQATLRATRRFRMTPGYEGREVLVPLRWQVPRP